MSTEKRTASYHVEQFAQENRGSYRDVVITAGDHLNETLWREGGGEGRREGERERGREGQKLFQTCVCLLIINLEQLMSCR